MSRITYRSIRMIHGPHYVVKTESAVFDMVDKLESVGSGMKGRSQALHVFAIAVTSICTSASQAHGQTADAIYAGGEIVTVDDARPTAEAVAVKDGKILAVGTRAEVERAHKGPATRFVDLGGKALLPGLIDAHSHYFSSLTVATRSMSMPPRPGRGRTCRASSTSW